MMITPKNEFESFIDTLVDELIDMSGEQVLEGLNPAAVHAVGLRMLNTAKAEVGRSRLAAAKAGYAALKTRSTLSTEIASVEEARRFLAEAKNDERFTLAARNLGELSDDEVLDLYRKLRALQSSQDGTEK
jgi:hypothetical protein